MSKILSNIEELRLQNLKLLHGTAAKHTAPTSDTLVSFLVSKDIKISAATISSIYLRNKVIDESLAAEIESAFKLHKGWLTTNHNLWLSASIEDSELMQSVLSLPIKAKQHLNEFLSQLNN